MKNATAILATLFVLLAIPWSSWEAQEITMRVSGKVVDATTGEPIEGASVSAPKVEDIFPVATDEKGGFKLAIPCSAPVAIKVEKEKEYKPFEKILKPQPEVELAIRLERSINQPEVMMTEFVSGEHIKGSVENISPEEYDQYRVRVYVLTDKWYIHPSTAEIDREGYAEIRDGTWEINTVFRGRENQARRVAFLLTEKATFAPATVETGAGDPNRDLLSRIETIAKQIIDAPPGI